MKVDIKKIIDAIEMATDFTTEFYDVQNGEIVTIFDNTSYFRVWKSVDGSGSLSTFVESFQGIKKEPPK